MRIGLEVVWELEVLRLVLVVYPLLVEVTASVAHRYLELLILHRPQPVEGFYSP